MPLLAGLARVVVQALQRFVSGLRWLARQAYIQRSLGVASNPQLTRLLDIHFVTVAAHLALLAALLVVSPSAFDWLLSLPLLALFTGVAIWRPTRLVVILLLAAQLVFYLVAAVWAKPVPGILLTILFAMAVAQQAAVIRSARGKLGRATAAGLLLGVFTGGVGLIVGLLVPAFPLWICILLIAIAIVLSLRMAPPPPPRPALPRQDRGQPTKADNPPEGYAIYRPSSLDEQ